MQMCNNVLRVIRECIAGLKDLEHAVKSVFHL